MRFGHNMREKTSNTPCFFFTPSQLLDSWYPNETHRCAKKVRVRSVEQVRVKNKMPLPPPPPPPPPPPSAFMRTSESFATDILKKSKSAKNTTTKSKLTKKEMEKMERERLEQMDKLDMENEIAKRMSEIRRKKEKKGVKWKDADESDEEPVTEKPPKKEKKIKMSRKEKREVIKRMEKERLEKLKNIDPETEIQRRMKDILQKDDHKIPKWDDVKVKEDLRSSKIWTTENSRIEMEKERLDRELEKFDREKEMERKMSEILTRKDPWKPGNRPEDDDNGVPKPTSVQGRVREAILRQEREAQEKIQREKDRQERAERQRIIRERDRIMREQKEIERKEQERIERELQERREREIREMVRKQVEAELRRIPRNSCASHQCHNLMHCCIEFAGTAPIEGCSGVADQSNSIIEK